MITHQNKKPLLVIFLFSFLSIVCGSLIKLDLYNETFLNIIYYISSLSSIVILLRLIIKQKGSKIVSDDSLKKEIIKITNGHLNKGLNTIKNRLGEDIIKQKKVKSSIKVIEEAVSKLTDLYK